VKILMNVHQENMIVVIIFCVPTIMVGIDVIVQEVTEKVCPNDIALISTNVRRQVFECVNNNVKTQWVHTNVDVVEVILSKMIKSTANETCQNQQ